MRMFRIFNLKPGLNILLIFLFIFSFYIVGPLTSSMLAAIPGILCFFVSKNYQQKLWDELKNPFIVQILLFQFVLMGLCFLYSGLHLTFDLSYVKVMFGQFIQLICGIFIILYIDDRERISSLQIEKYIIIIFLLQSVVQLIAMSFPSFASFILYFSRANDLQEAYGGGVRGLALSSGVGWSLGLSYGLVYIIYVKRYLLAKVRLKEVACGLLLFVGTFFAGRTGFVGALIGAFLFFLNSQRSSLSKFYFVLKILLIVIFLCGIFYFIFPSLVNHLIENVFPFAFEPFYKLYYNDSFETGSTNKLLEMWQVSVSESDILMGRGYFTDPFTGSYYERVDVGILRNLFYWGIGGYFVLLVYQWFLIQPIHTSYRSGNMFFYRGCIALYLVLLEFKAMTLGFNKMTFSILFLLSYFYYQEYFHSKQHS